MKTVFVMNKKWIHGLLVTFLGMLLKQGTGNGEWGTGSGDETWEAEKEKWEHNREFKMKFLILGLDFKLGLFPIFLFAFLVLVPTSSSLF